MLNFIFRLIHQKIPNTERFAALRQILQSPDLQKTMPKLMLSAFLSNILAMSLPLAILQIMDRVVSNKSIETLTILVIGIVLTLLLEEVLKTASGLMTSWLGTRFEHHVTVEALDRMMHVPMRRFLKEEPGAYAERIMSAGKVAEFYSGQALLVVFDLPFIFLFLGMIFIIGGWVVLVPLILLIVFALVTTRFVRHLRELIKKRNTMDDRRFSFLSEVMTNIHSVKTMNMEALMQRRYERLQEANAELGEALTRGNSESSGLGTIFSQVMTVCVVFASSVAVIKGQLTPGGLAACMMLSVRALQPLRKSLSVWLRFQSFSAAHERLNSVMNLHVERPANRPRLPKVTQSIELKEVEVRHRKDAALFEHLNLTVKAGECVVIQGGSGSGKTSLLCLMNGLESTDAGSVLIDGVPLSHYDPESICKEVAFLPQAGVIVAGTLLENMTMFDPSRSEDALEIAKALGLNQLVAGMKLGYETPLGEGAADTLPIGVRQMITLARALAFKPSVILFDEANISLDMEGDKLLLNYLSTLKGKCTLIMVTHRPSFVKLADRVYELKDGTVQEKIQEQGFAPRSEVNVDIDKYPTPEMSGWTGYRGNLEALIQHQFSRPSDLSRCLYPLLKAVEWKGSIREFAEAIPHLAQQLDLSDLCSLMSNLGWDPRHFETKLNEIDARLMPSLFIPSDTSAALVLLEAQADGRIRGWDGALNQERIFEPEALEGTLYLFTKKEETGKKGPKGSWFVELFGRFRRHIALAFLLTGVNTILGLATPFFVRSIYDHVLPSGNIEMAAFLLVGVLLAIVVDGGLRTLKGRIMAYIGGRTEFILSTSVFSRILGLPASATEGASVTHQVSRIKSLEGLRDFFLGPLALLVFDLPSTILLVVVLAMINPWLLFVVLFMSIAFAILAFSTKKLTEKQVTDAGRLYSIRGEFLNETLNNMRTLRAVGAEARWLERFREMSGKAVLAGFHDQHTQGKVGGMAQTLGTMTGLFALATSAFLAIHGQATGGTMIAGMMIVWRLVSPIQNVFLAATSLVRVRSNMAQIERLMKLQSERDGGVHQTIRPDLVGALAFQRVSFRYSSDADPALLGVNFSVKPGQLVVITGPNGSGKSTLLKLVVRVYIPQAGTIRLDSADIRQLASNDLRSRISYMPQNCEVFYGTVAQNLRLVHPGATEEEVRWAVEMAGLTEDVKAMPQGFETRIANSRSDQLPYGFRQRLSLARIILKPASVVLLDEPGTGMDAAGEEALVRCIEWLRGRATVLMVSHRPGHMRMANLVLYMENGSVVSQGSFDQVKDKVMAGMR